MRGAVLVLIAAGLAALAVVSSTAAPSAPRNAMAIASDLGVGLDELVACSTDARIRAEGPHGSPERKAAVQAMVLDCLQSTRPEITAEKFDAVMARYQRQAAAD